MPPLSSRLKRVEPGLLILFIFAVSRLIFFVKGVTFHARPLFFAYQYLDPVLLKDDLLRSLFYLNSQPPLFNLFLGLVLKCSPDYSLSYEILFKTIGALIPLLLYGTLVTTGIKRRWAAIATIVFMLNPSLMLYENLLYYTYFEAFFVLLSIFSLARWCTLNKLPYLVLFWTSLLCLGLTRSLFHPVFFLITAGLMAMYFRFRRPERKQWCRIFILSSSAVLIPLFLLCMKNLFLFGFFGTSSWQGINLWTKVNGYGPEELEAYYARGVISVYALKAELQPFQSLKNYPEFEELKNTTCPHPACCNEWKSSGKPNFNHVGYVCLSKRLWKDAVSLIKCNPSLFLFQTAGSYSLTLWYSSDSVRGIQERNMEILEPLDKMYRFLFFGFTGVVSKLNDPRWWDRTIVITIVLLLFYISTVINLFRKDSDIPAALAVVCLFCLLIHTYTLLVSSLIEFGENNRFRLSVDAPLLVLMAGNIEIWRKRIGTRVRRVPKV